MKWLSVLPPWFRRLSIPLFMLGMVFWSLVRTYPEEQQSAVFMMRSVALIYGLTALIVWVILESIRLLWCTWRRQSSGAQQISRAWSPEVEESRSKLDRTLSG
jgi:hypothetical protein